MTGPRLGSQIWLERDDPPERVRGLVASAAQIGIGQLRAFLMWPWIQAQSPNEWDFRLFDTLFDAAAERGLRIKATLTANSGPWWLGTPSVLHSDTLVLDKRWWMPISDYIAACVTRYRDHPALGQWILWNEPYNPAVAAGSIGTRPDTSRAEWQEFLRESWHDIAALNTRWRTGYTSFDQVGLAEEIAHPVHRTSFWRSFGPELADAEFRAGQLEAQLSRIAMLVRQSDASTPLCINPTNTFESHALRGYRVEDWPRSSRSWARASTHHGSSPSRRPATTHR